MASRACRDAYMIGDSMKMNEMEKIVGQMASLNLPWNCPHGRPTLIKLLTLKEEDK